MTPLAPLDVADVVVSDAGPRGRAPRDARGRRHQRRPRVAGQASSLPQFQPPRGRRPTRSWPPAVSVTRCCPSMKIFVPGRICLFGEHSDWAGGYRRINADIEKGYTLICGTNQGIHAEVEPHPTALVLTSTTPDGRRDRPARDPARAEGAARGGAAGRLLQLRRRRRLPGAHALPRPRPRDRQHADRPADQEGALVERRDLRAHGARVQPGLRPEADGARRDGAGLPGRDHDAVALRPHGPGLRVRRPRRS